MIQNLGIDQSELCNKLVRGRGVQQLFQIAFTGHGCVSSIHAPGARDLLTRLGGDEMGVTEIQQASISYLLHIQKIKAKNGRVSRKATSLTEMVPGTATPHLYELFSYDPAIGSFSHNSIEEVASSSKRLGQAVRFLGIDDVVQDLQKRMTLLQECVNHKAYKIDNVFEIISKYYDVTDPKTI